jgi:hypothetical protein
MTSYKGVRVLDDFNDVDFLVWKPLALGHFGTYHPETAALVLKNAEEIEADIVRGSGNDAAVEAAARAAAARCDQLAKGHIMLLLGPTFQAAAAFFWGKGAMGRARRAVQVVGGLPRTGVAAGMAPAWATSTGGSCRLLQACGSPGSKVGSGRQTSARDVPGGGCARWAASGAS